jgi:hypothetical protein
MADLPARPNLDHLRRQARDLPCAAHAVLFGLAGMFDDLVCRGRPRKHAHRQADGCRPAGPSIAGSLRQSPPGGVGSLCAHSGLSG